jgi:hypothetical protein
MKSCIRHREFAFWALVLYYSYAAAAEQTEGQQQSYFETIEANEYDDRTLLDTFGQAAKEFLTKKVIPDTDAECKWDWRYVRCGKSIDLHTLPFILSSIICVLTQNVDSCSWIYPVR